MMIAMAAIEYVPVAEKVAYPIKVVGSRYVNVEDTMDASTLYRLQLAVFNARMTALQTALAEGYVPVDGGDDHLEIEIRVKRRVVSAEATDGKWITVPVDNWYLVTQKLDTPIIKM